MHHKLTIDRPDDDPCTLVGAAIIAWPVTLVFALLLWGRWTYRATVRLWSLIRERASATA